jgi:hypothetical protein
MITTINAANSLRRTIALEMRNPLPSPNRMSYETTYSGEEKNMTRRGNGQIPQTLFPVSAP